MIELLTVPGVPPIWLAWLVLSGVLFFVLRAIGDRHASTAAAVIVIGLVLTKAARLSIDPPALWLVCATIWVSAGDAIRRLSHGNLPQISVLLVLSGLCYTYGWALMHTFAPGSAALTAADAFGAMALAYLGGRAVAGFVGIFGSGWRSHRRSNSHHSGYQARQEEWVSFSEKVK